MPSSMISRSRVAQQVTESPIDAVNTTVQASQDNPSGPSSEILRKRSSLSRNAISARLRSVMSLEMSVTATTVRPP